MKKFDNWSVFHGKFIGNLLPAIPCRLQPGVFRPEYVCFDSELELMPWSNFLETFIAFTSFSLHLTFCQII